VAFVKALRSPLLFVLGVCAAALACAQAAAPGSAGASLESAVLARVRDLAQQAAQTATAEMSAARVQVELGQLDPRLRLAPCAQVQPYLPQGQRMWGRTRIGLRCTAGAPWNVYLPVTVKVWAPALVLAQSVPAGTVLEAVHLARQEVDVAAGASPAVTAAEQALGRTLTQSLSAGEALQRAHLRPRQWFAAGDTVRVVAAGDGYSVSGEAQALGPGLEGQSVRLRTDSGRIVSALPVAPRQAEVAP
jgi:flagella basal body P-ring formation protein FlgA